MSKKRNQVLFTKPEDPTFLKLIKAQAGYKEEGPSIESKVGFSHLYQELFTDLVGGTNLSLPFFCVVCDKSVNF